MTPIDIASAMLALVLRIIDECQIDNNELIERVETGLLRESSSAAALDWFRDTYVTGKSS